MNFKAFKDLGVLSTIFVGLVAQSTSAPLMKASVPGVGITNMHQIYKGKGEIYRGVAPRKPKDFSDLKGLGITHVVLFKDFAKSEELDAELASLNKIGVETENTLNVPFVWKDLASFKDGCEQTIDALEFIKKNALDSGKKLYFHCTVGEDRTGYLAGILRQLNDKWDFEKAYKEEMCKRGYADGNPKKPRSVYKEVHEALSPLYWKMSYKISKNYLSWEKLDRKQCDVDPEISDNYSKFVETKALKKICPVKAY